MILVSLFFFGSLFLVFDLSFTFFFFTLFFLFVALGGSTLFGGLFFLDGLSFFLVFLVGVIFLVCVFSSMVDNWYRNLFGFFYFYLFMVFLFLFFSFMCFSILFFYVSFEFIFILMFLFLLSWGYSPERLTASFYMVFYTLVVSFPFLIFLVSEGSLAGHKFFWWGDFSFYWWPFFIFVLLVKLPVYGVHLWLPKAHVEAPVSGSMVLAGVLLKLGGYGILRFSGFFLSSLSFCGGYLVSVGVVGGLYSCFLCLRQADLKSFVAYSSVCHMGFGLGGLYSGTSWGYSGGVFMMVAHGFCSSCLFYILFVLYERFFTRSGMVLKGVGFIFPMILLVWFIFSALNMGVPPSFSFFSEILILSGLLGSTFLSSWFSMGLLFFAGLYGIFFYVIACHSVPLLHGWSNFVGFREYLLFWSHFYFLIFIIFSLDYFFF